MPNKCCTVQDVWRVYQPFVDLLAFDRILNGLHWRLHGLAATTAHILDALRILLPLEYSGPRIIGRVP